MEHAVGPVTEFTEEDRKIVTVGRERIVVLCHNGEFFALSGVCAHMGGPVAEGLILGKVEGVVNVDGRYLGDRFADDTPHLICPWHGWEYDLRTGESACLPTIGLKTYETEIRDEHVYLHV